MKTKRDALSYHYCLDWAETEDYRYHYGRTSIPIYAFNSCYACVTKGNQKPAKHRDGMQFDWKKIAEVESFIIWESEVKSI